LHLAAQEEGVTVVLMEEQQVLGTTYITFTLLDCTTSINCVGFKRPNTLSGLREQLESC
jgi:hypothetical protein